MLEMTKKIKTSSQKSNVFNKFRKDIFLYILLIPALVSVFVFKYIPLPGLVISFMNYDIFQKFNSPWVGFDNIIQIFQLPQFSKAIWNTLMISCLSISINFPVTIIFALLLNELKNGIFKKTVQTISYLPYFLSMISVVAIVYTLYSKYGIINDIRLAFLGKNAERVLFYTKQALVIPNILMIDLWKNVGWGSIIYLAALTGLDPQLYEAAYIDGANRFKQILYITLPGIMPTAVILLILRVSEIFKSNFEMIYGLQNAYIDFEVISTVIYKYGIAQGKYSIATAFGFTEGIVSLILIILANQVAKKLTGVGIW